MDVPEPLKGIIYAVHMAEEKSVLLRDVLKVLNAMDYVIPMEDRGIALYMVVNGKNENTDFVRPMADPPICGAKIPTSLFFGRLCFYLLNILLC